MKKDINIVILIVSLAVLCTLVFIYSLLGNVSQGAATLPRMEPLTATFTADNDVIKVYVVIDPDTAQQYIVSDHGGITPRLNI